MWMGWDGGRFSPQRDSRSILVMWKNRNKNQFATLYLYHGKRDVKSQWLTGTVFSSRVLTLCMMCLKCSFFIFSRIGHALFRTKRSEVTALTLMLWLDYAVARKINNFAWPWHLYSQCLGTICAHQRITTLPRVPFSKHPCWRLAEAWWETRAAFSLLMPRGGQGWGNLNQQLIWNLERLPLDIAKYGKNSCHQANIDLVARVSALACSSTLSWLATGRVIIAAFGFFHTRVLT